jgi:hypothetical protein
MNNTMPMTTPTMKDAIMRRRSVDAGTTDREWKLPPMARLGMDQNVMPPLTLILIMSVAPVALSMSLR